MSSVRSKLLTAMLACAVITLIGSLIAWRGLERLETQVVTITNHTWPTADGCMELWIAELTKDRARLRPNRSDTEDQIRWAKIFARGALQDLIDAGDMTPGMIERLQQLDQELDSQIEQYLAAISETEADAIDRAIDQTLVEIEGIIIPEEDVRDVAMDVAAEDSVTSVRDGKALLAAVTVLAVLIAVGLALWLSTRIVRPIHQLATLTQRIGDGAPPPALNHFSRDEIGDLARSFDEMAQRLATSHEELLASEQRYRTLFEHARHGIVVMDHEYRVLEANPAMGSLLRIREQQLEGQSIFEFLAGTKSDCLGALDQVLDQRQPSIELRFHGSEEPVAAEVSGVRVPDGRTVLVIRDTRELRRIEQALIQSEKLSAVGQLAAGVAHELRNPLFVISNVIYELRDSLGGDREHQDSLDIADEENARARKIIDNLLEFSRTSPEHSQSLEPEAALRSIVLLFRKTFEKNRVTLRLDLDPVPACLFDPDGFKQVVVNLLTNAVDAMPRGGDLTIRTLLGDEGWVRVEIGDSGSGMDESQVRQAFNPFYSTKAPGVGTGLGLWIVHSTVVRHEGRIEITSQPGAGTTFSLDLPVAPGEAATA